MVRLSVDDLVADAVEAFKNNECIEEPPEEQTTQVICLFTFFFIGCLYRLSNQLYYGSPLENRRNKEINKQTNRRTEKTNKETKALCSIDITYLN